MTLPKMVKSALDESLDPSDGSTQDKAYKRVSMLMPEANIDGFLCLL